ncbi:MAG: extracellular solute-binding protein [Dehalococcoidia bacterium]
MVVAALSAVACGDDDDDEDASDDATASEQTQEEGEASDGEGSKDSLIAQFPEDVHELLEDLPENLIQLLLEVREAGPSDFVWANDGGEFEEAEQRAFKEEWEEITGWTIVQSTADRTSSNALLKTQVDAGNVEASVYEVADAGIAQQFASEGYLEELDLSFFQVEAFPPGSPINEFSVDIVDYASGIGYNTDVFPEGEEPTSPLDIFDLENFPGKRCLFSFPQFNSVFEFALMADGVAFEDVFDVLRTDEGVEQARAKIESIVGEVVWIDTYAESVQFLVDGECDIALTANNRVALRLLDEPDLPLAFVQEGGTLWTTPIGIPEGAPEYRAALSAIAYAVVPRNQCDILNITAIGILMDAPPFPDCLSDFARERGVNPEVVVGGSDSADPTFWAERNEVLQEVLTEIQTGN